MDEYDHCEVFSNVDLYTASRQEEINGLIERGVFGKPIKRSELPPGARIFGTRFLDQIKNKGTDKAYEKSRLVVQAFGDDEKSMVLTQSPTIQRVSQRLLLCVAAILMGTCNLHLRDITQAYVQSKTPLLRKFSIRPPPELLHAMSLPKDGTWALIVLLHSVRNP